MLIVGLTGSIGTGKSTAAGRFRARGIAVCDADALVHSLYEGRAAPLVEAAFPGVTVADRVDRDLLSATLAATPEGFAKLEAIVHPLVQEAEKTFLRMENARGARIAVLEIPLLFETGGERLVDVVVVTSAPPEVVVPRVLARPGMTPEKFEQLTARQTPDAEKRARADFVVDTTGAVADTAARVDAIIDGLEGRNGEAYERHWA